LPEPQLHRPRRVHDKDRLHDVRHDVPFEAPGVHVTDDQPAAVLAFAAFETQASRRRSFRRVPHAGWTRAREEAFDPYRRCVTEHARIAFSPPLQQQVGLVRQDHELVCLAVLAAEWNR
jgi:hypothetical protein